MVYSFCGFFEIVWVCFCFLCVIWVRLIRAFVLANCPFFITRTLFGFLVWVYTGFCCFGVSHQCVII